MRWTVLILGLAACTPVMLSPEQAAEVCEDQARAAQGPTGSVTIGANSGGSTFTDVAIGVSSDFLTGRDPMDVYEQCVYARSGQAPIRFPDLR
ncbi:hypothetical protein [Flavimaricola marinus]|uniref:Lipoprotein n=1 Tax=Flavimaricola marinus TaxID=1819565 RepID=A0A238L9H0_9RHOB|nr:hypothetical protein [Flavimaricola marinus]SMY06064.1 hypothetical protein LOM8899_00185 [Flavimaricola marinus]